jgi:hypothetical protein
MVRKPGGSNHLIAGRAKKAMEHIERLTVKYVAAGLTKKAAKNKAYEEARNNPRRDWRAKAKKK